MEITPPLEDLMSNKEDSDAHLRGNSLNAAPDLTVSASLLFFSYSPTPSPCASHSRALFNKKHDHYQ